jgi:hypothetical protein
VTKIHKKGESLIENECVLKKRILYKEKKEIKKRISGQWVVSTEHISTSLLPSLLKKSFCF